jgi:hypothetical protein
MSLTEDRPDKCTHCGRPVARKMLSCRPCAIAAVRGVPRWEAPCPEFVRGAGFPHDATCDRCGYDGPEHPMPRELGGVGARP